MTTAPQPSQAPGPGPYQSPLVKRIAADGQLTNAQLVVDLPPYKTGAAARTRLRTPPPPTGEEAAELHAQVAAGDAAAERLFAAGTRLVSSIASSEGGRRKNWRSSVTADELFQSAAAAYLRALQSYDPEASTANPASWITQYVVTVMRRDVEPLDNDLKVPHRDRDVIRRVHAIHARLQTQLGRHPTDEELIAASKDGAYRGTVLFNGDASAREPLSAADIADYRRHMPSVGQARRLDQQNDDYGSFTTVDTGPADNSNEALAVILSAAAESIGIPEAQWDIICRSYGVNPYVRPQNVDEIAAAKHTTVDDVNATLATVNKKAGRPLWRADSPATRAALLAVATTMALPAQERTIITMFHGATPHTQPHEPSDIAGALGTTVAAVTEVIDKVNISAGEHRLRAQSVTEHTAVTDAARALNVSTPQWDMVCRYHGLNPYERAQEVAEIARFTGVSKPVIADVLDAFKVEMARQGGHFHGVVHDTDPGELAAAGLGWVHTVLGDYPSARSALRRRSPEVVLTAALPNPRRTLPPPPAIMPVAPGIYAQFYCDVQDRQFVLAYTKAKPPPKFVQCRSCPEQARRIRVLDHTGTAPTIHHDQGGQ